jgi:hypothetical protein
MKKQQLELTKVLTLVTCFRYTLTCTHKYFSDRVFSFIFAPADNYWFLQYIYYKFSNSSYP